MMPRRSHGKGGPRPLAAKVPRILPRHNTPPARAYRACYVALASHYGTPEPRSLVAVAMKRAALAQRDWDEAVRALEVARDGLSARFAKRRASAEVEVRRLTKALAKLDEVLTRALADLRAVVPPPAPPAPLTREERERQAYLARRGALTPPQPGGGATPRPIPPGTGRDEVRQGGSGGGDNA